MKEKRERLKPLMAYGMSPDDLIRQIMSADPRPLWEEEKREREEREERKRRKKAQGDKT